MRELIIEKFEQPDRIDADGTMCWFDKSGNLHRENDMPAWIWADGSKLWHKNGRIHRCNDKPAAVYTIYRGGCKCWYKNGKHHRKDNNPAVVCSDGEMEWWINGKYIKKDYKKSVK